VDQIHGILDFQKISADGQAALWGCFKVVLRARHARHLSGSGFGIETFDIAGDADLQGTVDVDEPQLFTQNLPH
jgi:hypothetical protein